jgi:hypothetical protein
VPRHHSEARTGARVSARFIGKVFCAVSIAGISLFCLHGAYTAERATAPPDDDLPYAGEKIGRDPFDVRISRYGNPFFLENQERANAASDRILGSFRRGAVVDYPEHYGGAYLNEQGVLTVLIRGDLKFAKKDIISRAEDTGIAFLPCVYSYREMQEIQDAIYAYQIEHPDDAVSNNINFCMTIVQKNRIEVGLFNNAPDAVSEFKKNVCDSDAIVFKSAPMPSEYSFVSVQ